MAPTARSRPVDPYQPAPVALLLGALRAGACVVAVDPQRGLERTRREIASLALPYLAGEPDDLERLAGSAMRSTMLSACDAGAAAEIERRGPVDDCTPRPGVAVQMLTSGTTGPPKRVDLPYKMLRRVLVGAKHYDPNRDESLRLRAGVAVVNSPLVHLGGLFRVLQCVSDGRSFALLERFTVDAGSMPSGVTGQRLRASCPRRCAWCSRRTSIPPT